MTRGFLILAWALLAVFSTTGCSGKMAEIQSNKQRTIAMILTKQILQCEQLHYLDYNTYTDDISELECIEDLLVDLAGTPYTICLSPQSYYDLSSVHYELPAGIETATDGHGFSCAVVGQIDDDASPDVWTIDENGEPVNAINDLLN